jgi:periplasmic protein TonB
MTKRLILLAVLVAGASTAGAQSTTADSTATAKPPAYFEFQVERTALPLAGSPGPSYPPQLRAARVEGEVLAQFVVGTDGRPDMRTFKVLRSSHELFSSAVRDAVNKMRFQPAEIEGRAVRQVIQQPFVFALGQ